MFRLIHILSLNVHFVYSYYLELCTLTKQNNVYNTRYKVSPPINLRSSGGDVKSCLGDVEPSDSLEQCFVNVRLRYQRVAYLSA